MIKVSEVRCYDGIRYHVTFANDKKIETSNTINYRTAIVDKDNKKYYILYSSKMIPLSPVFDYINFNIADASDNTKEKTLSALRFLYSFSEIIGKEIDKFAPMDVIDLRRFLLGYNYTGTSICFENLTERSNKTINGYFSIYRSYLNFLNVKDSPFFNSKKSYRVIDSVRKETVKYDYNVNVSAAAIEVPDYVSVEDFKKMLNDVRKRHQIRDECIIRLMYESGLRIGEVLGLTNEDVVIQNYTPIVLIRNRITDKPYQKAKTCMEIKRQSDYKKAMKYIDSGYQIVTISQELYELIGKYIDEEHSKQRIEHKQNYQSTAITDSIDSDDENFYIFLNGLGKPLSQRIWNIQMREIFNNIGLVVDKGKKEHNLNHRLRHGFAMFNVKYMKKQPLELKLLLRHKSLASVSCYYKPTREDQIQLKGDFIKSLYDVIPELKGEE